MIKVQKISKAFKDMFVLHNISFEVKQGDFIAVMGPSGSGKSTLLYSISGMDTINGGRVLFEGINISKMQEEELSQFRLNEMGFVFQNPHMLNNLSIYDNIILPGLVAKKESADNIRRRGSKLMKQMGISGIEDRDIREVSGGQLQRASICRAMINQPKILFLDEPTGALNSSATDQVLEILKNLNDEGMTIMSVTHDPRVAARAKQVLYMRDGQIAGCKVFGAGTNHERQLDEWLKGF